MASEKGYSRVLGVQAVAFISSLVVAFFVGVFQNLFTGGDCYSFFAIGSCDANSVISYLFKLYILVMFSMSLAHFGFIKWSRRYYFILLLPLLLFGLSDSQFAPVAAMAVGFGVVSGLVISRIKSKLIKS